MRALVAGIGGIGGWLLARLTEGGADVTGWCRGETFRRLAAAEPLELRSYERSWTGPVRVVDRPAESYDLTFVTAKSQDTATIGDGLVPGPGVVVSVQNGVDNPEVLRRRHERVLGSVVYSGCVRLAPTVVEHAQNGLIVLQDDGASGEATGVADWLEAHGVRVRRVPDIAAAQWQKLTANVIINSICALTRLPPADAFGIDATVALATRAGEEVRSVAAACGVQVPKGYGATVVQGIRSSGSRHKPSTLQDVEGRRALEVDALTGAVVRRAGEHGIDVPTVAAFDALLRAADPVRFA